VVVRWGRLSPIAPGLGVAFDKVTGVNTNLIHLRFALSFSIKQSLSFG
jgi:hypothetical protein